MANRSVKLPFLAMERSLRATGCEVPLLVIPYNDALFALPKGSKWWKNDKLNYWLQSHKAQPVMRKYQCLTENSYQFVDSDVIFLKDPVKTLERHSGFITSCTHWHNPEQTYTEESFKLLLKLSTIWQCRIFNTGQFACDRTLYHFEQLKEIAESKDYCETCLHDLFHEQPGINMLVAASGVTVTNLTLPPIQMESTWAGDYVESYEPYWQKDNVKPYLIHWAGGVAAKSNLPINKLFENYLTAKELREWNVKKENRRRKEQTLKSKLSENISRFKKSLRAFIKTWMETN